jgi:O-methyltransferase involved in polyketide biosynthesis
LARNRISVLECDQPDVLPAKQSVASRRWPSSNVAYFPLDLNDASWPAFEALLRKWVEGKTLVLMEGVTPYVDDAAMRLFLQVLAGEVPRGSLVAYDFKLKGVNDSFGSGGRTKTPFRLASDRAEAERFHLSLGYELRHFELSDALTLRIFPSLADSEVQLFSEDALVCLNIK